MVCFCFLSSLKHSWGRLRISKHHLKRHPWPLLWVLSTVSVACTVAPSPLLKFPKSTTVICRISGCKTWHRSMVLSHQCLQPARWLVGFSLLTFISVLQSDAPTAVALTLGLVQQTSPLLFSGGGGLHEGLGRMMPPKEVPLPVSFWKSGQYGTAFPHTAVRPCSPYWCGECISRTGEKNVRPYSDMMSLCSQEFSHLAIILCALSCLLTSAASPFQNVIWGTHGV